MRTYSYDLSCKTNIIQLLNIGDVHLGHRVCDESRFKTVLEYARKTKNCFITGHGDWMEFSFPGMKIQEATFEQRYQPDEQMKILAELLKPVKEKILFMLDGNHEKRLWKKFGISPTERILLELGRPDAYAGVGGFFNLNFNKEQFVFACLHGKAGAVNPRYEFERMEKVYRGIDIYYLAHNHDLYIDRMVHYDFNKQNQKHEQKQAYFVRTGSFLDYATYAQEATVRPRPMGCTLTIINSKTREIKIEPFQSSI